MSQISVVQILKSERPNFQEIILANSSFFKELGVEYIIYDNLKSFEVLKMMGSPNLKKENIKYFRKNFSNLKTSFLESGLLSTGEKIVYLKEGDIMNIENVERLEKDRPNIFRKDLRKINNLKLPDFKYDDFNLLVKDKKTFWEKLKLLFF